MKRVARVLETVTVAGYVILIAYLVYLSQGNSRHWRDSEACEGLHEIILQVEHYAVDHDGKYPLYLTGGDARWSARVDVSNRRNPFTETTDCPKREALTDPLLRAGYLTVYPRNPFAKNGVGVHQMQLSLPLNSPTGDPLRNGADTGLAYGTRFGADCSRMGQVLGARCYTMGGIAPAGTNAGDTNTSIEELTLTMLPNLLPGADTEYRCWGIWTNKHASNPLPGQFIYSTKGSQSAPAALPANADSYFLAVFGGPTTEGQDVLGADGSPFGRSDGVRDGIVRTYDSGCGGPPRPKNK